MLYPRLRHTALLGLLASTVVLARPSTARAFSPYLVVPEPAVAEASAAYRYANMSDAEALAELDRRKILYMRVDAAFGVRAPVRLTGRLHGVNFHSSLPPEQRVRSMYEILDARLALALDDFAALLEKHDIDEVIHFSLYRPNVAPSDHAGDEEPAAETPSARSRSSQQAGRQAGAPIKAPAALPMKAPVVAPMKVPVAGPMKAQASLGPKGSLDLGKGEHAAASRKQKEGPALGEKAHAPLATTPAKKGAPAPIVAVKGAGPGSASAPVVVVKRPPAPVAQRDASATVSRQTWAPPGTRHPAGLAIDVGLVHKRDGRWLSVARSFHGHLGDKTCGDGAQVVEDADAREMHALVCESAELGLFTYVLTPNYNAAHADHFHMEIKPGVRWFLTH